MTSEASSDGNTPLIQGIVFIALTVDGFIATPDGGVDFLDSFHPDPNAPSIPDDAEEDELGFPAFMKTVDCLVMGRKTFEKVLSFGRDMWAYGKTPVIVWSRNPGGKTAALIPEQLKTTVSCSSLPPAQLFADLNAKHGYKRVYIDGGTTIRQFLAADLIDEMILTRVPILLGEGIPLFDDDTNDDAATAALKMKKRTMTMKHIVTKAYPSGLVTTKYQIIRADDG
jgi:dihydrofolate reductase